MVVQYLNKAEIKLPIARDNAQQRSTPAVICPLLSLVHRPGAPPFGTDKTRVE